jgi:hypothetical protein
MTGGLITLERAEARRDAVDPRNFFPSASGL